MQSDHVTDHNEGEHLLLKYLLFYAPEVLNNIVDVEGRLNLGQLHWHSICEASQFEREVLDLPGIVSIPLGHVDVFKVQVHHIFIHGFLKDRKSVV